MIRPLADQLDRSRFLILAQNPINSGPRVLTFACVVGAKKALRASAEKMIWPFHSLRWKVAQEDNRTFPSARPSRKMPSVTAGVTRIVRALVAQRA
jgi:hypothetical protein